MMWDFDRLHDQVAIAGACGYTYSQLSAAQSALVSRIHGRCLVFCLCQNSAGSLLGYAAFVNHRIVPLLLDQNMDAALLGNLIEGYRPAYLWVPAEKALAFADYRQDYAWGGYALLKTPYRQGFPLHEDLALLLTTSGSTGSPKLVRQSYANIRSNMESIAACLALDASERPITTLPMSYTYGLSILHSHLHVGASILLEQRPVTNRDFWRTFAAYAATSFGGVPYTYEILNRLRFFSLDLPSLRTMTQAGGKLPVPLHRRFAQYAADSGRRFFILYGQTEATARMAYLPAEKAVEKCGSIGIPIPGGRLSLVDARGREITAPEGSGELVYEGENVTLGYATRGEDLSLGDERGGRLLTGDMARRDPEGYYYILGRKHRFLKVFGNRVSLDELEQLVKAFFPVEDCACGGVDDQIHLYIQGDCPAEEISRYLCEKTSLHRSAFVIRKTERIPKNQAGKTLYSALEGAAGPADGSQ